MFSGQIPYSQASQAGLSAAALLAVLDSSLIHQAPPPYHASKPASSTSTSSQSERPRNSPSSVATGSSRTSLATRPRSRTAAESSLRPRRFTRPRANTHLEMSVPDSPPPYSPTPPEPCLVTPVPRASSSPHLRASTSSGSHHPMQTYSIPSSSSALAAQVCSSTLTTPSVYLHSPHSDADETCTSDDGMLYTMPPLSLPSMLRSPLLRKKIRTSGETPTRYVASAQTGGETETEGEDSSCEHSTSRADPVIARFTYPGLPSWFIPFLFLFFRFLSVVPAAFGVLWNLFHLIRPPHEQGLSPLGWRVEFFVSILWSILTGWQCLQLTTGLLKRWRVYYSPEATLVRLLGLQAICWPATHLTLTLLNHERRPALCWAVIGTTTCYSRSIQLWVTSNIGPAPPPAARIPPVPASPLRSVLASASGLREEWMKLRRRRWDWAEVTRKCILPAGVVYFIMAWADMFRREWDRARC